MIKITKVKDGNGFGFFLEDEDGRFEGNIYKDTIGINCYIVASINFEKFTESSYKRLMVWGLDENKEFSEDSPVIAKIDFNFETGDYDIVI